MTKTNALLTISIAAILTLSVVAIGGIPQVAADKDDWDDDREKPKHQKADFESKECIVTGFATNNLPQESLDVLDCKLQAWLDKKGKALHYQFQITGMELVDSNTNHDNPDGLLDDIDGMHIHKNTSPDGTPQNPKGPHQLNVFGNPGFDDSNVVIKPVQGIVKGIWTDADENLSYGEPNNSHTLTENLQLLCEGKIFSAVHGEFEDTPGHKAPYLKMLLEPTKDGEKICKKLGY
jgi:hypothetical protein